MSEGLKAPLFSVQEMVNILDCRPVSARQAMVSSVVIDSRKVEQDALFVPLPGTKTDGHDFIESAVASGASCILVALQEWKKRESALMQLNAQTVFVVVENPLSAMQQLAAYYVKKLTTVTRLGITGSNGKTTTKEIVGSLLNQQAATYINEGNFNSDIGLPLSVFKIEPAHKYAVLEMGMNYKGEMDILAGIVQPHYGIITNIGKAHIGPLGSMDMIAAEKKKIFKFFTADAKGFVNEEERYFSFLADGVKGEVLPYGQKSTHGFEGYRILGLDGTAIYWEGLRILFPLIGYHNLQNALAGITIAQELGMDKEQIKNGLEQVRPLFGRSQIIKGEQMLIQDCYNANPDSMKVVLNFINTLPWQGRKLAVLGSMRELGTKTREAHREIGMLICSLKLDFVFLFGAEMESAYQWLTEHNKAGNYSWTTDMDELITGVMRTRAVGDLILLKGSRGVELERLVDKLHSKVAVYTANKVVFPIVS